MPGYRAHLTTGFITGSTILYTLSYHTTLTTHPIVGVGYLGLCLLGSLFPDIDTYSKMQQIALKGGMYCMAGALLLNKHFVLSFILLAALIIAFIPHRGITHQPWFIIMMPIVPLVYLARTTTHSYSYLIIPYTFFVAGALSHIILDRSVTRFRRRYNKYLKRKKYRKRS
jgi:hypothetical protein